MSRVAAGSVTSYRRYVLAVLFAVYTLNFLDRSLMVLLLQPIKEDLRLSDTQLGLLTGIAFGVFYAVLGVPIARLADRGNRVTITSIAIALWSITVMATFFVTNFLQMIAARVAAAVGEAGCMPPTYSLVGDYFPRSAERTWAMAVYKLAAPTAALISFVLGGWMNEHYGWRLTFFWMAIPGLLFAILVKLTVVEPRAYVGKPEATRLAPSMLEVLQLLWRQRSSRHLSIALILLLTLGLGLGPWYAAFMMRSHDIGTAELGIWLGLIFGVVGIGGVLLGGYVASRWLADDEPSQMLASAIAVAALVPSFILFLLLPDKHHALLALAPLAVAFNFFYAPAFALMQRLVPDEMRATTIAVVMLLGNLIGMGVGPLMVGALSDRLTPMLGTDSLRYAMLIVSLVALWGAYHFWQVSRSVREDLATRSFGAERA